MHPIIVYLAVGTLISTVAATQWPLFWWLTLILVPLLFMAVVDASQTKQTIRRNFPLLGRGRYYVEAIRPFIRQYLMESDIDGAPINRMFRSVVYQRAKGERDSVPFGTKVDVYRDGYEWISHSMAANDLHHLDTNLRVLVGGSDCRHHEKHDGDLVWQIGTSYFGCRDDNGNFNPLMFQQKATQARVKMIEIKLSQGAKPGHGGILPADKNTDEIAAIRHVSAHTQVDSPPAHTAFSTPKELLEFVQQLRDLSDGKPVGFKLCVGRRSEFASICKAMLITGIKPDFITVDGGEGGTGAAPLEYSNSIGMPLRDGLAFVCDMLTGFGLKQEIKVIASGKIISAFHLVKNLALGADICNSARGNMMALGCVQSLICNTNECPTGVATQDQRLSKGLVVKDKAQRVYKFHHETVKATADIIASAGLSHTQQLNRGYIFRRVDQADIRRYDEIYPYLEANCLTDEAHIPKRYIQTMAEASPDTFVPDYDLSWVDGHLDQMS